MGSLFPSFSIGPGARLVGYVYVVSSELISVVFI